MIEIWYDREDLVSGVGEHLDKLESALNRAAAENDPTTDMVYLVETARAHIRPAMDAARAALDEAVLQQQARASERFEIEQRRVALAKAALCQLLAAASMYVEGPPKDSSMIEYPGWLYGVEIALKKAIAIAEGHLNDKPH